MKAMSSIPSYPSRDDWNKFYKIKLDYPQLFLSSIIVWLVTGLIRIKFVSLIRPWLSKSNNNNYTTRLFKKSQNYLFFIHWNPQNHQKFSWWRFSFIIYSSSSKSFKSKSLKDFLSDDKSLLGLGWSLISQSVRHQRFLKISKLQFLWNPKLCIDMKNLIL